MAKKRTRQEDHESLEKQVAITTAIISVFLALATILGNTAGGNSSSYLVKANDQWSYYQAKSVKQNLYEVSKNMLLVDLNNTANSPQYDAAIQSRIADFDAKVAKYAKEQQDIQKQAQDYEALSDKEGNKSDVYNYAQGFYQIAIILAAIALLAKKRYMWFLSVTLGIIGVGFTAYAYLLL